MPPRVEHAVEVADAGQGEPWAAATICETTNATSAGWLKMSDSVSAPYWAAIAAEAVVSGKNGATTT